MAPNPKPSKIDCSGREQLHYSTGTPQRAGFLEKRRFGIHVGLFHVKAGRLNHNFNVVGNE